jgi:hypothetical protein
MTEAGSPNFEGHHVAHNINDRPVAVEPIGEDAAADASLRDEPLDLTWLEFWPEGESFRVDAVMNFPTAWNSGGDAPTGHQPYLLQHAAVFSAATDAAPTTGAHGVSVQGEPGAGFHRHETAHHQGQLTAGTSMSTTTLGGGAGTAGALTSDQTGFVMQGAGSMHLANVPRLPPVQHAQSQQLGLLAVHGGVRITGQPDAFLPTVAAGAGVGALGAATPFPALSHQGASATFGQQQQTPHLPPGSSMFLPAAYAQLASGVSLDHQHAGGLHFPVFFSW